MSSIKQSVCFVGFLSLLTVAIPLHAQERDLRAERLVLDDNGTDSTFNTITIQAPSSLPHDLVLTIPDPGTGTAEFVLASSGSGGFWGLDGNSGTTPGTHFLGTTDSVAVQIQVRGASGTIANSLILNENGSLQRDTGGNARGANAVDLQISRSAATYVAGSDYSVIGGGEHNGVAPTADYSTIGGGSTNAIHDNASYSTIGGGGSNTIDTNSRYATIGGGELNVIGTNASHSTIAGGEENSIDSTSNQATIGGGRANQIRSGANSSTIGGGFFNRIFADATHATIGGGEDNRIREGATHSAIIGGFRNDIGSNANYSTIGGGLTNNIKTTADFSSIGGGQDNVIDIFATNSTIGGGRSNSIGDSADYGTIGGGRLNIIRAHGDYSTIGGGFGNVIDGQSSVIPGGRGLRLEADRSFGFLSNSGSNGMTISESDVAVFGNTNLWLANNTGTASQIRFYEANTGTGNFPSSDFYTSFEAPALGATIEYILPGTKPTLVGQVLEVSAINGNEITLTWGTDDTRTDRDGADVPTTIAVPDDSSGLESRVKNLEAELKARRQLLEAQKQQIEALQAELHGLDKQGTNLSLEDIELKESVNVQNAE
ncbi:MAG: hypothetical protein AB7H80_00490 [Candidatus Kapaibacterium sp.]